LRIHHGAVDRAALTCRPPSQVLAEVIHTLRALGLEVRMDGHCKIRCVRRRAQIQRRFTISSSRNGPIYGDPTVDSGEEIRFAIEICRFRNLPGLYIVDIRRLRGNLWAYKFIYHKL
ncbi:uncharacterized protein BYT42DRAFT_472945, partial [Radiomyces spectabilis]|uniref:uncharacterized protein n=1 Tax=Radiomyces spectabilis TaxID=64574 RepID=UPI0022208074